MSRSARHRHDGPTARNVATEATASVTSVPESPMTVAKALFNSGLMSGARPDRLVRRMMVLARYGHTLASGFATAAVRDPHRIAVIDDNRSITYADLDRRVRRIAAAMAALGVGPGTGIAMYQRNSVYAIETMVAASRAGADALLLNTFLSPTQITEILHRERPRLVIVDGDLRNNIGPLPEGTRIVIGAPSKDGMRKRMTLDSFAASTHPDLAPPDEPGRFVILTSGTTGVPKGVQRGAPKSLGPAASLLSRIPLKTPETMLIAPPVFHTLGLGFLQLACALTATIVLPGRPDPKSILAATSVHRCTSAIVVPVLVQRMVDLPEALRAKYDTSALRTVVCGSASLPPDVCTRFMDTFGEVLYNIYGSTEASWATIATPEDLRAMPGTVGRPPIGTRLALLDEDGRPVPRGEVGRIFVGNEMMFEGYTDGMDKERIDGLVSTGDVGVLSKDDLLMVLGRDDDMVVVGGENIYPIEVEELLISQPQVQEVAVVGVPDDDLGQRLAAYVVLHEDAYLTADEVRDLVRWRLNRYSVPRDVVFLDELPRNTIGKVVPRLLPPPEQDVARLM
jgi:acyl-CoA synthetase (AMP-forming)/AMP-acid ligase II